MCSNIETKIQPIVRRVFDYLLVGRKKKSPFRPKVRYYIRIGVTSNGVDLDGFRFNSSPRYITEYPVTFHECRNDDPAVGINNHNRRFFFPITKTRYAPIDILYTVTTICSVPLLLKQHFNRESTSQIRLRVPYTNPTKLITYLCTVRKNKKQLKSILTGNTGSKVKKQLTRTATEHVVSVTLIVRDL